jgi:membrane protease YdiL (CAAX protease family)
VILAHAILTPLLEELLFRYVPIALLSPHSSAGAVIYSSLFFAFVHANLYQLPYAFIAGVIFAVLDIATGSILPSITMHILNNAISVLWLRYADAPSFRTVYAVILFALALSSVPFIIFKREALKKKIKLIFRNGGAVPLSIEAVLFFAFTFIIALLNI